MTTFLEQQEDLRRLLPGASKQVYQISYRIKKVGRTPEYSKIYNDFIGLIEKLQNEPLHDATSSFIVQSYHKKSAELLKLLSAPLDPELDELHIIQVYPANRASLP